MAGAPAPTVAARALLAAFAWRCPALVEAVRPLYRLSGPSRALFTEDPVERIAQCQCGQLRVIASGEPDAVNMCHCSECQRRTGALFGSGAYYEKSAVRIEGPSKLYTRDGQEDRKVRIRFCPNCGSSVYWEADLRPGLYGIAVGAFADPRFPLPSASVWEQSMHSWVAAPPGAQNYSQGRQSAASG